MRMSFVLLEAHMQHQLCLLLVRLPQPHTVFTRTHSKRVEKKSFLPQPWISAWNDFPIGIRWRLLEYSTSSNIYCHNLSRWIPPARMKKNHRRKSDCKLAHNTKYRPPNRHQQPATTKRGTCTPNSTNKHAHSQANNTTTQTALQGTISGELLGWSSPHHLLCAWQAAPSHKNVTSLHVLRTNTKRVTLQSKSTTERHYAAIRPPTHWPW